MGDYDINKRLQEIEDDLGSTWNHKGEPWCIVDPSDGHIINEGTGGIFLRFDNNNAIKVTEWFDDISAEDLGVVDIVYPHLRYHVLTEKCYEDGPQKAESLLKKWDDARLGDNNGILRREADIPPGQSLDGMVVTHYHPDGQPLSDRDIKTFQENNVLEMRAFGKGLLYILRRR